MLGAVLLNNTDEEHLNAGAFSVVNSFPTAETALKNPLE